MFSLVPCEQDIQPWYHDVPAFVLLREYAGNPQLAPSEGVITREVHRDPGSCRRPTGRSVLGNQARFSRREPSQPSEPSQLGKRQSRLPGRNNTRCGTLPGLLPDQPQRWREGVGGGQQLPTDPCAEPRVGDTPFGVLRIRQYWEPISN